MFEAVQLRVNERLLKVLITRGSIGGFLVVIFLRQARRTVKIFESSRFASETGAAIHIPSNVNGLLRRMGIVLEDYDANQCEWVSDYRLNGEQVFLRDVRMLAKVFLYLWQLIHRVNLHNALKEIATSSKGKGTPAVLHLRSRVAKVDVGSITLTLEDGTSHAGDLIIRADGVYSKIRSTLIKDLLPLALSGSSAFRFLILVDMIRSDSKIAHFVERTGEMRLLYGGDRRILNFVAMYPDEETKASADEWNQSALKETMLHYFRSYLEDVKALLTKAEPENAVTIGALFPLGTRLEDITKRLEMYVQARYDCATIVQEFTCQVAFKTTRGKHGGKVMDPMHFTEVNFNYNAFDNAHGILLQETRKVAAYLSTLLPSNEFAISSQGGWTTATFSVTKLDDLNWLSGRGYSFFGLYVHDVTHTEAGVGKSATGKETKGDFLPTSASSYKLSAGWEGTEFCQMNLEGLADSADAQSVLQTPVLTCTSNSPSNEKGTVEMLSYFYSLALPSQEGERRWRATTANIKFTELEGKELEHAFPTLANIVKGLRGINIAEVLTAGVQASE
ncbi:hypothetical protein DL95DRAFT_430280 [Leptodontidium sp. 2 PMI_412]|nr:hypothetical protein DL95DRAFT_430280 [Leptodontidium sp. 2 PMI_412]